MGLMADGCMLAAYMQSRSRSKLQGLISAVQLASFRNAQAQVIDVHVCMGTNKHSAAGLC